MNDSFNNQTSVIQNAIMGTLYSALYKWLRGHTSPGLRAVARVGALSTFTRVSQLFCGVDFLLLSDLSDQRYFVLKLR